MASQQWVSLLNPASTRATGPGTNLVSSASTATISPCQAGALTADVATVNPDGQPLGWYPGLLLRVTARGYWSAGGTTSNVSWLLRANKGNNNSYQTLATTTTLTMGTAVTLNQWFLDATIRCSAVSQTAGTCLTQGELRTTIANPAAPQTLTTAQALILPMPNTNGETSLATVDTTQVTGIGLAATLSAAFGTISCTQWLVEALD
jgi:hypothetical protein